MAEFDQLTGPMLVSAACFDSDNTWLKALKDLLQLRTPYCAVESVLTVAGDAVGWENTLS